ncbi:UTP--glucose-1-phosphate uridylyltransferase GalU [Aquisalinus flavus]|uniref:UTP--glucose-1-phosphate uridylyltransferase n=1 Tax=Aquisalinus flavus TaxID=1526572 RepID=A0A8J2V7K0_9PROT|nr:UTP--glucose-1-phosphate uridylyltransferase GalU [Aquisalinus flavus]MBD0426238.1 UTP--glucose-1-phosphate uridylyltransferase GalU [Aquisalinus flavus]UNE48190.1 UTP--glucose-1-phosphate uridylyltransferase GalU [Aquisalinus flavus]GGD09521.1 UTP--glucose-1-phosphate uridylyltransferase [Aquisalinus flavus]
MNTIRKVVIPVAGHGTRVLPATKSTPKELLPVVDRPLLDYVVDEALQAGIEHVVMITSRGKSAIEDYFDHAYELEDALRKKKKDDILASVLKPVRNPGSMSYTRQQVPAGLGHAIWCARDIVGNEAFAISLPDVLIQNKVGALKQMVDEYEKVGGNIVAVEEVPRDKVYKYGVIAPDGEPDGKLVKMTGMVEKPPVEEAPSNLAITGRYILQPEIFDLLAETERGAGNEIQLTDAMAALMKKQPFHAYRFDGVSHDCGDKLGWLKANLAMAKEREEFAGDLADYVKTLF